MWSEQQIEDYLKKNLNRQRYEHSLRVRDTSISLAVHYGENIDDARLAGLVHDCAKNMNNDEIINILEKSGYNIDDIEKKSPFVLHGIAGAFIARDIMEISNENVLNAIAYHTTGRANMTKLEKIIYLADYIEPLRNFPGVLELREKAYRDLDEAMLMSLENTIKYIISKNELMHLNTIRARNYLIFNKM